jgi:murein DD-endopeptidase MepM/ murein hydrolase activator NlpD
MLFFTSNINAQNSIISNGGEVVFNQDKTPCLTDIERENIKADIKKSIQRLKSKNKLIYTQQKSPQQVLFDWPVSQASGFSFNEVWAISNYVDHNALFPNQIIDYNCGSKTYDTAGGYNHKGVDIYLWPFSWSQVDNNQAEVVAAQAGQIVLKNNGNFDRSCSFNNNQWNAVYIQHSDGSVAFYGHMKNGSLTAKPVGSSVVQGEFLGVVASSGNSTGPHLHFEVYNDLGDLIYPYIGACNNMNATTWWNAQKPYVDSNINAVLTHSAPPVFNACPTTETTNIQDNFLLSETVYFAIYLRDQVAGTTVNLKITRPDSSIFAIWNFALTSNYNSSYWYWWNTVDAIGTWTWEATYEGQTVTHTFNVSNTLGIGNFDLSSVTVYPNPFNDIVNITSESKIVNVRITDMLGKIIYKLNNSSESIRKIDLPNSISKGIYFIDIESDLNHKKIFKIIKE